jgi:hypothetical protein
MRRTERGQALPFLALTVVVAGVAVMLLGRIGGAAVDRARASAAADAAALAGAAGGRDAADSLARENGGRVLHYQQLGDDARVTVEVGDAEAVARARRSGGGPAEVPAGREGAAPAMLAALARADQVLGGRVLVTRVAAGGLEVDVGPEWAVRLEGMGGRTGLCPVAPGGLRFGICPGQ